MSDKLLYDDQLKKLLEEIPLPSEDAAWNDMKRRLEEDDDDKPLIPPLWKGCGLYGLLFLLLLIITLFTIKSTKWFDHTVKNRDTTTNVDIKIKKPYKTPPTARQSFSKTNIDQNRKDIPGSNDTGSLAFNKSVNTGTTPERHVITTNISKTGLYTRKQTPVIKPFKSPINTDTIDSEKSSGIADSMIAEEDTASGGKPASLNSSPIEDSSHKPNPPKKKQLTTEEQNEDQQKKHHFYFGAGFAFHQLLPVAGQETNPYNALGRKSFIGDYIPSIYARLYQEKKWFVQAEFRYGAPQYTKDIVYIPKKIIDSSGATITYASNRLKKTFYHQVQLSFNYYILPGFSTGAGVTINTFKSALVQRDVHINNVVTQSDSLINSSVVSETKSDSNFINTYLQALIEIQYQWKRITFGSRYSFGLNPYLKFTLPGGEKREEKNSALQVFLRFELWKSKKD